MLKPIFKVYHLNKGMAVHFEGHFIPYNGIPDNSALEWPTKQKNCTKMAGAYQEPRFFSRWVFLIFKCRETSYVLERRSNQMFSKAVSESADEADKQKLAIMDKYIQDGASLSKNVENSGCHHLCFVKKNTECTRSKNCYIH